MIRTSVEGRVGLIRIYRPEAGDVLNSQVTGGLAHAAEEFDADPAVGAIAIMGDERALAAAAGIKEMAEASPVEMLLADRISHWDRILRIKKPVIAALSGWCLGGGQ